VENPRKSAGLDSETARMKLERDGPNLLTPPKQTHWLIRFGHKFLDGLMLLLLAAGMTECARIRYLDLTRLARSASVLHRIRAGYYTTDQFVPCVHFSDCCVSNVSWWILARK
jgi:hypothetical protein